MNADQMSGLRPYYQDDFATIYLGDCREILPNLQKSELVLTDPPYGMGWNTDSTRFTGGKRVRGDGRKDWGLIAEDDKPFDPSPWIEYPKCILWGSNHFGKSLPVGTTLVWLKKADHLFDTFLSDGEIAWMKGGHGVYAFRKQFPPPSRMAENFGAVAHPTQKPIALMQWCLQMSGESKSILDPFMGSGTTLVAAKQLGRQSIGIEIEERYCEIASHRLQQEYLQLPDRSVNNILISQPDLSL